MPGFLVFLFLALLSGLQPWNASSQEASKEPVRAGLQVEITCSLEKLRTTVARVSWRTTQAALSLERLEVTVYKDGFRSGAFATLSPIRIEQRFDVTRAEKVVGARPPGLNLVVTEIQTRPQKDAAPVVVVEGLEPGLNYFWRVVRGKPGAEETSEVVRTQARACPADMPKEQKPRGTAGQEGGAR